MEDGMASYPDVRPRAGGPLVLAVICLAPLVGFLLATALSPFLPVIAADLHVSVALLGQIPAASMLVAAALSLVVGPLADHSGPRRLLLAGTLAVVVSALGTALAPSFAILLLVTLIAAVSRAIIQPVALAITGTHFTGAAQRRAISLVVAAAAGAPIVGVPALTAIGGAFGWRYAFGTLAALALVVTLLGLRVIPPDPARTGAWPSWRSVLAAYPPLLRHAPTISLIGSSLLRSAAAWAWFTYYGAYLVEVRGLSVQQAGWGYTGIGLGFFLGSLLSGGRLGHLPPRALLIVTALVQGVVLLCPLAPALSLPLLLILNGVGSLMMGVANVTVTLLLGRESPAGRATTMTANQAAFSLGSASGGALGGLLLALSGYGAIVACIPVLCSVAAALVWFCRPRPAPESARAGVAG
jgi:predicted MFS family arabinose efflux permease